MASWLKAAEDLFEVVDRRAKLVVGELSEEQSESQLPVSSGKGSQGKRSRTKTKGRQKLLTNKTSKTNDSAGDPSGSEVSQPDATPSKDSVFTGGPSLSESVSKTTKHHKQTATDVHNIPAPEESVADTKTDAAGTVAPPTVVDGNATEDASLATTNIVDGDAPNDPLAHQSPTPLDKEIEVAGDEHLGDPPHSSIPGETALPVSPLDDGKVVQHKDAEAIVDTSKNLEKDQEQKAITSPMKIQDQLEEAQGLLKTAVSTGQSKEARLARVCAGLSSRLQEYKAENAQLEELLTAERELTKSCEAHIKQLQKDLSSSKSEVTKVETGMAEALAAKNSEIEALVSAMDALKRQAALTEGNLASLQGDMDSIMRNRELTETRMMQALREELATAERRAEEERVAHSATKMAAMEREVELEHRALEASTALARIQRLADERMTKVAELEQKVALLEVECSSLNQELQDMEARARRGQKKSPEEANQVIQVQAWQEEVERARQGQRDAEEKLSSMEAETQKLRVEVAAMKRDAEHYSRQEHMELEKRYRELTDLLYYKQTQLETMASEKAAAEFQLEKEMKRQQEAQVEAERSRVSRRTSATWEEDAEMKALEPLPLYHRHMTTATLQLQKAAKLLDSGAVRATRFLWRYPTARVILLFYLVFVHLFLMYLLHRLQEQADGLAALEVAESMGLANPIRP